MHANRFFGERAKISLLLSVVLLLPLKVAAANNLSLYLCENNRILRFSPPFSIGMSANTVVGATNFDSVTSGLGPDVFGGLGGIDHDTLGNLFVADSVNNRVLEFLQPITTGESASLVIGQPVLPPIMLALPATRHAMPTRWRSIGAAPAHSMSQSKRMCARSLRLSLTAWTRRYNWATMAQPLN